MNSALRKIRKTPGHHFSTDLEGLQVAPSCTIGEVTEFAGLARRDGCKAAPSESATPFQAIHSLGNMHIHITKGSKIAPDRLVFKIDIGPNINDFLAEPDEFFVKVDTDGSFVPRSTSPMKVTLSWANSASRSKLNLRLRRIARTCFPRTWET